jgi:hypothetical protein
MNNASLEILFKYCEENYNEGDILVNKMSIITAHIKLMGDIDNYNEVGNLKERIRNMKRGNKYVKSEYDKKKIERRNLDYNKGAVFYRSVVSKLFPLSGKVIDNIDLINIVHPIISPIVAPIDAPIVECEQIMEFDHIAYKNKWVLNYQTEITKLLNEKNSNNMTILQKYQDIEACIMTKNIINIKLNLCISNLSNVISFFSNIDNNASTLKRKRLLEENLTMHWDENNSDDPLPLPLPFN